MLKKFAPIIRARLIQSGYQILISRPFEAKHKMHRTNNPTSQRTHCVSITKPNRSSLLQEWYERNTLCGKMQRLSR
jgi:hypothetical protein